MTVIKQYTLGTGGGSNGGGGSPFGWIGGLIMLVVGLTLAFLVVKGIFHILLWVSIPLLIAGVALDPGGALSFAKKAGQTFIKNPLIPAGLVLVSLLSIKTIPFVLVGLLGGFLIAKAMLKKKIKEIFGAQAAKAATEPEEEDFTEFEEVVEEEDFLELPDQTPQAQKRDDGSNEYDNMF